MSFYDNFKTVCKEKGLKMTNIIKECGGASGSLGGWKVGKWPNSEIVVAIAARLSVSCDRLLLGISDDENEKEEPALEISENGWEMLELYEQLPLREQILLLGRLQEMVSPLLGTKHEDGEINNVKAG